MIRKILVANRGEIAVRIIRSCRELGLKTVAVFSEADRKALHVRYADEAYFIGPSPSNESYLVMDKILDVAKKTGTDAIHPGYGFLSENATFARRVKEEGIIFIGPSPEAISAMGDKITARKKMIQAGVPVVPGTTEGISDENEVTRIARDIGLPVMIKASAGGGGKGMRLVTDESELINAVRNARSEAKSAFGDDTVYVEKYISSPHHIEFQVLADRFGNTIHLCERECSIQRRHQKIIEETPSPLMTPELREEMGKHAVSAAKSVNYEGAGTVEFIVDDNLNYYFLEMNTRLQVEHPITERVTGVDLVKAQINIANGKQLAYVQEDIVQRGHAIECRIYAEDAENNFMPSPGTVEHISEPLGLGVRTDGYVYPGYEIPIYYDPMISKLITWGNTRDEALSRMKRSLEEYYISGIKTSINFLKRVLETPDFVKGKYNTHFIQNNLPFLQLPCIQTDEFDDLAFIVAYLEYLNQTEYEGSTSQNGETQNNRWKEFGRRKGVIRL